MEIKAQIVVFDTADLATSSAFWAALLGGTVQEAPEDDWHTVFVDGQPRLGFQLAPNHIPPDWPDGAQQQVHLDLYVEDLRAAHEYAMSVGARLLKMTEDPDASDTFSVYADPSGHPFCFCRA
jgi:catechol 2,3-dioxygenase-like lactoylglutathione lyase family enzyme